MITLVDSVVKNRWEKEFDSGTATKIVQKKLHKTINELIDDYTSF